MHKGKTLKNKMIQFLLLLSLSFNIVHASVIAIEDDCTHETAVEYSMEQHHDTDCEDLCDMHHLFHFMAIINSSDIVFHTSHYKNVLLHKATHYTPPFQITLVKPPIV